MKCRECPDYVKCVKESNLAIKRKNRPKAKIEKVKTNADRIRAMSDEELAAWMAECNAYGERADASQWLPWLKRHAE